VGVRGKGELGYQQEAPANVPYGEVHTALVVGEDPIAQESLEEPVGRGLIIAFAHAYQGEDASGNCADDLMVHSHCGFGDALYQADHDVQLRRYITCPLR
jgi:hypothetical protein